jgi:hypothetical protein
MQFSSTSLAYGIAPTVKALAALLGGVLPSGSTIGRLPTRIPRFWYERLRARTLASREPALSEVERGPCVFFV